MQNSKKSPRIKIAIQTYYLKNVKKAQSTERKNGFCRRTQPSCAEASGTESTLATSDHKLYCSLTDCSLALQVQLHLICHCLICKCGYRKGRPSILPAI